MGDIKRKRKQYVRPRKLYDTKRIQDENAILEKYGLKNKREVWKAETTVSKMRKRAKLLISASEKEREAFFGKLKNMGLGINNIEDVLALTKEAWLERRLQTFVFRKGLAKTPKHARQLVTHKNILVDNKMVNSPSFVVAKNLENKIKLKSGEEKNE